MELSLMILNLTTHLFLNPDFTPRENPDMNEYEKIFKLAHDTGYGAIDMTDMELEKFGTDKVKALMDKYELKCGSIILFENFTCTDKSEQEEFLYMLKNQSMMWKR